MLEKVFEQWASDILVGIFDDFLTYLLMKLFVEATSTLLFESLKLLKLKYS